MNKKQLEDIIRRSIVVTIKTKDGYEFNGKNSSQLHFVGDLLKIKSGKDSYDYITVKDISLVKSIEYEGGED